MSDIKPGYFTAKDNKKILIRSAVLNDAPQLLTLMKDIAKERIYLLVEPEEFKETLKSYKKRIRTFSISAGKLYLIAEYRNKIKGLIQFNNYEFKKRMHAGYLGIFISKRWRGKGIGRLLIAELLRWAEQNPVIEKVSLSVFSNNIHAINLYRKMGFRQEGLFKKEIKINGKYADSILMYKFVK